MISQTGRYALRILGYLADRQGEWVRVEEVATATGIPANYLAKIGNQLRKRGLVLSQKGWGGGFRLNEQALRVPIAEVLELIDGRPDEQGCIFELRDCDADQPCPLHHRWERVRGEFQGMIHSVTIGDLRSVAER
jgi:Rrf2 family transcriptional regulator, iron-sulfur cluster assembly transcription factor